MDVVVSASEQETIVIIEVLVAYVERRRPEAGTGMQRDCCRIGVRRAIGVGVQVCRFDRIRQADVADVEAAADDAVDFEELVALAEVVGVDAGVVEVEGITERARQGPDHALAVVGVVDSADSAAWSRGEQVHGEVVDGRYLYGGNLKAVKEGIFSLSLNADGKNYRIADCLSSD